MWSALFLIAASADPTCPTAINPALLAKPYVQFDTAPGDLAWRTLLNRGCVDSAVATLKAYGQANGAQMSDEQRQELTFHMGQALAMAAREEESIPHFEAASGPTSSAEWSAYVAAHLGFARKDRALLAQSLAAYEKLARPGSMRLTVIRGLLKCLDKPYMEAAHCGM